MKKSVVMLLLVFLTLGTYAYAKDEALEEVVITATRTEQAPEKAPAIVEVKTADEVRKANVRTVDEAIMTMPGVISDRSNGILGFSDEHPSFVMRGFTADSQNLVIMDGQIMNNYEGEVQWWTIPTENIERIEVVKGPMSSLYGGGAMGGVVNIITRDYYQNSIALSHGSYNTDSAAVSLGAPLGDVTLNLGFRTITTDGKEFLVDDDGETAGIPFYYANGDLSYITGYRRSTIESQALNLGLTWDMTPDSYLGLKYGYTTKDWKPQTQFDINGDDTAYHVKQQETKNYLVTYNNTALENVEFIVHAGLTDNFKDFWKRSPTHPFDSFRPNSHYNADAQANIVLPFDNTLTLGVDGSQKRVSSYWGRSNGSNFDTERGKMRTYGAFLQDQWDAADFLTLYAGVRYDHWKAYDAELFSTSDTMPPLSDAKESYVSPKLSVVLRPDEATVIRVSGGDAFRAPELWDMYTYSSASGADGSTLPNPNLKPETTRSYEGSIERTFFGDLTAGVTYFSNHIDDMIYRINVPYLAGHEDDEQCQNVGESYTKGWELGLDYQVFDWLKLSANQTRMRTRITDAGSLSNQDLAGKEFTKVPRITTNAAVGLTYKGLYTDIIYRQVSDRYSEDDNSDYLDHCYYGYDAYAIANLQFGYSGEHFEFSANIDNLFDRNYWDNYDQGARTYSVKFTARL